MSDFYARRVMMVDTQVRPSDVTKFPIIDAMLTVPRETYVPRALREAAYMGENLELRAGRVMLQPRSLAKMLESLDIQPTELVLDVGCGLGYSSAVIARLAEAVVGVEDDHVMAAEAEALLSSQSVDNAAVIVAPLDQGSARHGPFDVMVLQGAVEVIPDALLAQIKDGGRIGAIFQEGPLGVARVGYKSDGKISWRFAFNANAPLLKGFAAARGFTL